MLGFVPQPSLLLEELAMQNKFSGGVLFLDRSDINTDEIIPAKYLTENTKEALGPHLMQTVRLRALSYRSRSGAKLSQRKKPPGC